MIRRATLFAGFLFAALFFAAPAGATEAPCTLPHSYECFGVESVAASLSTTQAGAHPDLTFSAVIKQDPASEPEPDGLREAYATTRDIRFELPPGLVGDPNALGPTQQCTAAELFSWEEPGGGCPNDSQVGLSLVGLNGFGRMVQEPLYMMKPPGGEVVARVGMIAVIYPIFIDFRVRSEGDYGLTAEVVDASPQARLTKLESTTWGVPANPVHDTERCTPLEAFHNECVVSEPRPTGTAPLPFLTNPTRCAVPLEMRVAASSWAEPERLDENTVSALFPEEISGCNSLPFGPSLEAQPTSHRAGAPTGLGLTIKLPASKGVEVLEPSQIRSMRIDFPPGLAIDTGASDGLATCSAAQVHFEQDVASECPNAAKLASTEFDVPVLERNLKGAIYLREPEPGDPFRVWIVADDLGLHLKLPGDLEVDKATGQVHSIVLGAPKLEGLPQAPLREVKLELKSGFRAPLLNPPACGEYRTHYEFTPWSGGPVYQNFTEPFKIDEGCEAGGFAPKLSAGSTEAQGGAFSPFVFTITREDGEQNVSGLQVTLPKGLAASFAGIARCEGGAAVTGQCPAASQVGRVTAAVGAGPDPLWIPEPGKRPTAVYLGGPYEGAPISIVAVVPKQAGPFDFGDEVVRSAIFVDPETAQATAKADPLPQFVEGIPIFYKTLNVVLDRPHFSLNPTSCARKETVAELTSTGGRTASPSASYAAANCAKLGFKPSLSIRLEGKTNRGAHPRLTSVLRTRPGDANIGGARVALPSSEIVDNEHFNNICTRVQFAAHECPAGSVYGFAVAKSPLFDFPLSGPVYLRSAPTRKLPDIVAALSGPPSMPIEVDVDGHVDSVKGRLRTTFETVPDAPVMEFHLRLDGGKKGLIQNSGNLCTPTRHAIAEFAAQNGRHLALHPVVQASCKRGHKRHRG